MQRVFIETKYEGKLSLPSNLIEQLPKKNSFSYARTISGLFR